MNTSMFKKILYRQTLFNRGTYSHDSDEQKKLVEEMLDTLVNREKIERSIAEIAVLDRLIHFVSKDESLLPERVSIEDLSGTRAMVQYNNDRGETIDLEEGDEDRRVLFQGDNIQNMNLSTAGTRIVVQYENGEAEIIDLANERVLFEENNIHFESSLLTKLRNYISNHPFICIAGIVLGYQFLDEHRR